MPEDTSTVDNATQGEPAKKDVPCGVYERIEQR